MRLPQKPLLPQTRRHTTTAIGIHSRRQHNYRTATSDSTAKPNQQQLPPATGTAEYEALAMV
jgi:hypothetical protein